MAITAALVKELRERTGAGMMDCKKALQESNGDIEQAIDDMRKSGMAKAAKKAGRIAAEGLVSIAQDGNKACVVEINSETDFVAKGDEFIAFCDKAANTALANGSVDAQSLGAVSVDGETLDDSLKNLIAKLGENMSLRRVVQIEGDTLGIYKHGSRIGVIVALEGGNEELAKDIAMHIAASRPVCISSDEVPADLLAREREIFIEQAKASGKPDNIIEKMVEGRMQKYLAEVTLLGQAFVKDPDQSVEKLLKTAGAKVTAFTRMEVGEGIEKKVENFAEEVAAQQKASG
jgi:elongation factor Ts